VREAGKLVLGSASHRLAGWIFDITADYRYAFAIGAAFNLANLAILGALVLRRLWLRQTRFNLALPRR
jgi:hypothetical protein